MPSEYGYHRKSRRNFTATELDIIESNENNLIALITKVQEELESGNHQLYPGINTVTNSVTEAIADTIAGGAHPEVAIRGWVFITLRAGIEAGKMGIDIFETPCDCGEGPPPQNPYLN